MRVLLAPLGSHGDVHPFVGLGRALRDRGHRVCVVTMSPFRDLVERHGFEFAQIGTDQDYHELMHHPDAWHPTRSLLALFEPKRAARLLRDGYARFAERYEPGNTVIVSGTLGMAGRLAHEKLGVPLVTVHLQPVLVMSLLQPPKTSMMCVPDWWPMWLRRLTRWVGERIVMDYVVGRTVNRVRAELGLKHVTRVWADWRDSPQMVLGLFPKWFGHAPDWPESLKHVGFIRYDQGESKELPAEVRRFLDAGPPPVAFTFGSAMRQGRAYFDAAAEACRLAGVRGLFLVHGREQVPEALPDTILHADYAPFSLVFPRAAAVVHHGGIGTTAQALTAGVPQVVMPLTFDQPDNADRLLRLGVARVVPRDRFTGPTVAAALKDVLNSPAVAEACRTAAAKMAEADPLDEACRLIESVKGTDRRG